MSTLTPSELLNQLISNANAAKAKALQDAADLKAKIEAEQAEAKKLVDALSIANQFGAVHQARRSASWPAASWLRRRWRPGRYGARPGCARIRAAGCECR